MCSRNIKKLRVLLESFGDYVRIAIIGYGKMGHEIERLAKVRGIDVAAIIDPNGKGAYGEINKESLANADVAIDFSTPNSVVDNVRKVASLGKNMVVGTTGWYNSINETKDIVRESGIGFIYSPNFSIGVNLFFKIVEESSKFFDKVREYDVYVHESHHNQKLDSPSGTAKVIGDIILKNIKRKNKLVFDKLDRKISPEELHIVSLRAGYIPGTHVVGFDGEADTVELKHIARSRAGFAVGAVMAAEWINGKRGFYTIQDFISDLIGK